MEFILERGRNLDIICVHMRVLSEVILKVLCMHQETGDIRYFGNGNWWSSRQYLI